VIQNTLSRDSARRFYDFWGSRYDMFSFYEARAKGLAIELLDLAPGQQVLNVGLGTGKEHCLIQEVISTKGNAFGIDISPRMLSTAYERTKAPLCYADGGSLPFCQASFDRLMCSYVLDLIPYADIPTWISEFRKVLKPGGRMVISSLTEGVDTLSRSFVYLWKFVYRISPIACGGCRPLQLRKLINQSGFQILDRKVIVQLGVPSEVIVAV